MERLRIVLASMTVFVLAGCAGVPSWRAPDVDRPADGRESAAVLDSLAVAGARYREALSHYVVDEREEAVALLERSLTALYAIDPLTQDSASDASSLEARVLYFLDALGDSGREAVASAHEHARLDTTVVRTARVNRPETTVSAAIPLTVNKRVEKWLDYFHGKGRGEMQRWLDRSPRYRPMIEQILAEEGLPQQLYYLAVIESGLNPNAYSRAHACGMWQFISSRARIHGLRVDWWVDERRDPEKATRSAASYLKELYGMFGSWELALAGYNSGEGRVARAQKRRPSCPDYWCLDLPRETENFVPKFIAAALIGEDPGAYGFTPPGREPPLAYETVEVAEATDISVIAEGVGSTPEEIQKLNPSLRRWCTAPDGPPTTVRVPPGTAECCRTALASIPAEKRVTWRRHKISRGETLSEIAGHYGTNVRAILTVNDIRNPNRIRTGDYLIIPIGPTVAPGAGGPGETIVYRVCRGDTITSIARRFGKRTQDVLKWNGLGWKSRIYPGDTITIHNM
jgi:membrane-bound lytic murein transglycosylase D